jgi:hypothetical protein
MARMGMGALHQVGSGRGMYENGGEIWDLPVSLLFSLFSLLFYFFYLRRLLLF